MKERKTKQGEKTNERSEAIIGSVRAEKSQDYRYRERKGSKTEGEETRKRGGNDNNENRKGEQ